MIEPQPDQHQTTDNPQADGIPDRLIYLGVFAVAALIRGIYLFQMRDSPFFHVVLGDGLSYETWAQQIAQGDWVGKEIFYQAPLYPYFLAVIHFTFGEALEPVRLAQLVVGSASCVLLAMAGARFFDRRIGVTAGIILALYAPAVFFDGLLQKPVLAMFFTCLILALAGRMQHRPAVWLAAAIGVTLGLLALTRENALVYAPVLTVWLFVIAKGVPRWRQLGAFTLGLALVLGAVGLRNQSVGGEFVLTTAQMGPNFYIGNHQGASGTYQPLRPGRGDPRFERKDATQLAQREAGRELTPSQVSSFWMKKSFTEIGEDPAGWLRLIGRKAALTVNAREIVDFESIEAAAEESSLLALLWRFAHLGVFGPAAIVGIWLTRERWRALWVIYALAASMVAAVVAFYIVARYRITIVPELILFAAAAIWILPTLQSKQRRVGFAVVIAAGIAFNWPMPPQHDPRAVARQNVGLSLEKQGDFIRAEEQFRKVLAIDPDLPAAHKRLGNVLAAQGKTDEAIDHYLQCLKITPNLVGVHMKIAELVVKRGDLDRAILHWREAMRILPDYRPVVDQLAWALATHPDPAKRKPAEAVKLAQHAVNRSQGMVPAHLLTLAIAQNANGDREAALVTAQKALEDARRLGDQNLAQAIQQHIRKMGDTGE